MAAENVGTLSADDDRAPHDLRELAKLIRAESEGVTSWVFTARELDVPGRTLGVHAFPWGPVEATLTTAAPEPESQEVDAALTRLRGLTF